MLSPDAGLGRDVCVKIVSEVSSGLQAGQSHMCKGPVVGRLGA